MTKWTTEKISFMEERSKERFPDLLKEWSNVRFDRIDKEQNGVCDLCKKKNLKLIFIASSSESSEEIVIGSTCISLFFEYIEDATMKTFDKDGNVIYKIVNDANSIKRHALKILARKSIDDFLAKEKRGEITISWKPTIEILTDFRNDFKAVSPRQAYVVCKVLSQGGCDDFDLEVIQKLLKVNLKKNKNKEQLIEATSKTNILNWINWEKYLYPCLSQQQRIDYNIKTQQ